MFNDNACFGNTRTKIRPGGKCLCLSLKFHEPPSPRSFRIKYVIKRRERRVRAVTSAWLPEDGHLTVRPLGREFGSQVPSDLSGSSGPLSAGGWAVAGTRQGPGRVPGAQQKWQGAYAAAQPARARLAMSGSGRQRLCQALSPHLWASKRQQPFAFTSVGSWGCTHGAQTQPLPTSLWGLDGVLLDFLAFTYRYVAGSS